MEQETSQGTPQGTPQGIDDFQEGRAYTPPEVEGLEVQLDAYSGPLDVLLTLAQTQKVDLKEISISLLAEQYLVFIREAHDLKLELAADYLVMASWLAYLKSRLLLPPPHEDDEMNPEEMAALLVFRLQRLERMRECAAQLMARDLLGRDFFIHGMPQGIRINRSSTYDASLYELLSSYSTQRLRNHYAEWTPPKLDVLSIERARMRLERMLGKVQDWTRFDAMVAQEIRDPARRRTTIASSFVALLEYVRDGQLEVQQTGNFGDVFVRRARPKQAAE